jgi:hypothetical protein
MPLDGSHFELLINQLEIESMEYIKKKLEELAQSLLDPIWTWVMARSWAFRACVLVLGGGVFLGVYNLDLVSEHYRVVISTIKIVTAGNNHIALDNSTKERLSSTVMRLEATVNADLTTLFELTPWSTAQAIVAVGKKDGTSPPAYARNAVSLIRSKRTGRCFCWVEIPAQDADGICVFITGWVMLAFSNLNETISDADITYILEAQNVQGWWPLFLDKTEATFASTYSTAWIVLGLVEIGRNDRISSALRQRINDAVGRALSWLLITRTGFAKWKPYPNMANSKDSDSISGLVLHALHMAGAPGLHELDPELARWPAGTPTRGIRR